MSARKKQKSGKKKTSKRKKNISEKSDTRPQAEPHAGNSSFPVVGIGASAGGLEALSEFFRNVPEKCGAAFIVIAHLAPDFHSLLPELLQKHTSMNVCQVKSRTAVLPDHVYVIPPGKDLSILQGKVDVKEVSETRGYHMPIDSFFQILARDQGANAVAVVLSGTGSDGTAGIKSVKAESGLIIVQTPETAKYGGMPSSAAATGLADFILPPAEIPQQLENHWKYISEHKDKGAVLIEEEHSDALDSIFTVLRNRTDQDFSQYKRKTLYRRIERRMQVQQIETLDEYARYMSNSRLETDLLFKELLIGVTNFFRDPEAFEILQEKVLPGLIKEQQDGQPFRVWVPGCSTGEEAYSIAIALHEGMDTLQVRHAIQIFGTDLDASAIETARTGLYPASISADVSPDRLKRYFSEEDGSYRIKRLIREMLVFAPQNIIKDPPFTRLNMICCRNLLIYLNAEVQKKLLPIFHYSLKPGGILFLGSSETVGTCTDLFAPVDKKWKIFSCMDSVSARQREIEFPPVSPRHAADKHSDPEMIRKAEEMSAFQVVEAILRQSDAPPCAVINNAGEIVYIHGRVGEFLEPAEGRMNAGILAMARPGLKKELGAALELAVREKQEVQRRRITIQGGNGRTVIDLTVTPMGEQKALSGMIQVMFTKTDPAGRKEGEGHKGSLSGSSGVDTATVEELELELKNVKENYHTAIEELQTSNEELKSTNEELQSTNEELQSANEELETSREELQSLNEETITVNSELQSRIEDLSAINDDMKNLLDSTQMATVFLDCDMNVRRFTPAALNILPLLAADIGRPLAHFASNLKSIDLQQKAVLVLDTLAKIEEEVQCKNGAFYVMRIIPYRTARNVIDGVVITFTDISMIKEIRTKLMQSEERFRVAITAAPLRITVAHTDLDLKYTWIYSSQPEFNVEEMLGKRDEEISRCEGSFRLKGLKREVLAAGKGKQEDISFSDPESIRYRIAAEPLYGVDGELIGVTTAAVEIP